MKIKLTMDCGYVGTDYEEEMEVNDDITEEELDELATEFFWENFHGSYGYEIIEEWLQKKAGIIRYLLFYLNKIVILC